MRLQHERSRLSIKMTGTSAVDLRLLRGTSVVMYLDAFSSVRVPFIYTCTFRADNKNILKVRVW